MIRLQSHCGGTGCRETTQVGRPAFLATFHRKSLMADNSDDERQNPGKFVANQPYDEALDVGDAEEVASIYTPTPRVPKLGERRSRGNTPPETKMSEEDSEDFESDQAEEDDVEPQQETETSDSAKQRPGGLAGLAPGYSGGGPRGPPSGGGGGGPQHESGSNDDEDDDDDDDEDDDDDDDGESGGAIEGAYDPADFEHLPVTPEIKELFQYITRYTPQTIDLEHKLKPFIPDFIPAVGDIDAFIKVPRPDQKPDTLGLTVLDEPCAKQSDPTVLDLQLRTICKETNLKQVKVKSIESAEKNPRAIDNWIESISDLHRSKPPPNVHYTRNMPDIESLMQEWPPEFEELLKEVELPTAEVDCDLPTYVDMVCALLDIPVHKSKIQSLHVLFTLFSEFKNSQHFRSLADDNQLDNALKADGVGPGTAEDEDRLVL